MTTSGETWAKQLPLAERWTLVIPDRRGFEPNPPAERTDFEADAADIAPLLGDGAHLVGHSYGAMCALFTAALRPRVVRSLTVIEPPALSLGRGHPEVEAQIVDFVERRRETDPEKFMRTFLERMGAPTDSLPSPLPEGLERRVRLSMHERPPWEVSLPVEAVRSAGIPVLVVSGDHSPVSEMLFDRLAALLAPNARRLTLPGTGHVVQRAGTPFNEALEEFLLDAERALA
jgi:pimeloyl-ACP methyl ester carboxylesterase